MTCLICDKKSLKPLFKKKDLRLLRCADCGLVQVDNLKAIFDIKHYDYYKDRLTLEEDKLYNHITTKRYINLLHKLEHYRENNTLLDIGCGEGHFLSLAKRIGWEAMGLELAPYAVDICKKFNLNVKDADLLKVDLKNDYYDAVVMFEVLEHLIKPREYLLKINDILRRKGVLVITTPNFYCIARLLLGTRWSLINKEHLFYFTPKSLKLFLRECSFEIIEIKTKHITLPELYKLFRNKTEGIYRRNQEIRRLVETNKFLNFLKYSLNKILNLTGTGESIECICQKIC